MCRDLTLQHNCPFPFASSIRSEYYKRETSLIRPLLSLSAKLCRSSLTYHHFCNSSTLTNTLSFFRLPESLLKRLEALAFFPTAIRHHNLDIIILSPSLFLLSIGRDRVSSVHSPNFQSSS
jgi:hypothetical protein